MGFGIKKKIRNQLFGVKSGVHRVSKFGSKAAMVGEVLFPEVAAELALTKVVLDKVSSLTKNKKVSAGSVGKNHSAAAKSFVNKDTYLKDTNNRKTFGEKNSNVAGF